jgi:NitT/TauT family transport system substrate-binding protein
MRKFLLSLVLLAGGGIATASAAEPLSLQLRWVPQSEFAGYYVAAAKGYYRSAGLDVTIKPGGPGINPVEVIANGDADVMVEWMAPALSARERGVPLVNIAQMFDRSALQLACRRDSGVMSPPDLKGKTIALWFGGREYPPLAWLSKLRLTTAGGPDGVTVIDQQGAGVEPLLQRQVACVSTLSYDGYWDIVEHGLSPDQLVVFNYQDEGVATLEDGLYILEAALNREPDIERLARFLKASALGWRYAVGHQDEAVDIVLEQMPEAERNVEHQHHMMAEVAKLIPKHRLGFLSPAAYAHTVSVLLSGDSEPLISRKPEHAWTHEVWDRAGIR